MGFLNYGSGQEFEFDDRTLAHLKVVMTGKLRRQESFLLSWVNPADRGGGRVSIWITPSIPLTFRFAGSRSPQLNQTWLEVMNELSNTPRGLLVISEEQANKHSAGEVA